MEFATYLMNRCDIGSDCITIETDQRPVQEILKDLDLECVNHIATPCAVERKKLDNARGDECKGENRGEQGEPETQRDWDDESDRSDRRRVQVTSDGENDRKALTGGDITKYTALVARVSYLSQDRPGLKFASMQASCALTNPTVRDSKRVKKDRKIPRWQARSEVLVLVATEWRPRSALGRRLGRRPSHPTIRVGRSDHGKPTLPEGCGRSSSRCLCPAPRASCTPQSELRQKVWEYRVQRWTWEWSAG